MSIVPENRVAKDRLGEVLDSAVQTKVNIAAKGPDIILVPAAPRFAPVASTNTGKETLGINTISAPKCEVK